MNFDNPWATKGVTNKEWESSILGFLGDDVHKASIKRTQGQMKVLSPEFGSSILDKFLNLNEEEKAFFKARLFM